MFTTPKTDAGRRTVALDPRTVAVMRVHRKAQMAERLAAGPAWTDSGLVFTREDGRPLPPDWVYKRFVALGVRSRSRGHTSPRLMVPRFRQLGGTAE